jgi:hypothetical protein
MRVYIAFEYNPNKASFFQKARFEAAKIIYGQYPPDSAINYIWTRRAS